MENESGGLTITRAWFGWSTMSAAFATVASIVFTLWWMRTTLDAGTRNSPIIVPMILGIVVGYTVLACLLNRTWIRVANGVVAVTHGPVPCGGKVVLPCCEVEQFYCREQISRSDKGPRVHYEIWVATTDGRTRKLLSGVSLDRDQVLYIEQQLELAMGIDDRTVHGEIIRI